MGFWSTLFGAPKPQPTIRDTGLTQEDWKHLPEHVKEGHVKRWRREERKKAIAGSIKTARSETGLSLHEYLGWKGFEDTFTRGGYASSVPIRDKRYSALVKRYAAAHGALTKFLKPHGESDADKKSLEYVNYVIDQKGLDDGFVNYEDFDHIKNKRFHALRKRYLAARKALAHYVGTNE